MTDQLNLATNDTGKIGCYVLDYFSMIAHIYSLLSVSGVTNACFKQAQLDLDYGLILDEILGGQLLMLLLIIFLQFLQYFMI